MGLLAHHRDAMRAVAQRAQSGDVVGVQMRVDGLDQLELELAHELEIAVDLLQHRIDDQRLAALPAGDEIGVGAGNAVEQLAEDHQRLPNNRIIFGRSTENGPSGLPFSAAAARCANKASALSSHPDRPSSLLRQKPNQR